MINPSTKTLDMPPIIVLYRCTNLGYTQCYQSIPPKYPTLVALVLFPRGPAFPSIPMYPQRSYIQVLAFILNSDSSKRSPAKKSPQPSPLLMIPTATSLDIPQYQSVHQLKYHELHSVLPPPWIKYLHLPG